MEKKKPKGNEGVKEKLDLTGKNLKDECSKKGFEEPK